MFVKFYPGWEIPAGVVSDMMQVAPAWSQAQRRPTVPKRRGFLWRFYMFRRQSGYFQSTPFGKKLQERLGEKVADASVEFLKWIASTVTEGAKATCRKR